MLKSSITPISLGVFKQLRQSLALPPGCCVYITLMITLCITFTECIVLSSCENEGAASQLFKGITHKLRKRKQDQVQLNTLGNSIANNTLSLWIFPCGAVVTKPNIICWSQHFLQQFHSWANKHCCLSCPFPDEHGYDHNQFSTMCQEASGWASRSFDQM